MIISKIKLINWKNFLEAETALQERVFVVGANATGKSNFLDVFVFLNDLARTGGGLQQAVDIRGGVSSIRNAAATDKSYIGIEVHLANKPKDEPEYIYSIKFKGAGGGIVKSVAQIVEEKAWSKKADKWVLNRSEKNKKENHTTLQYTYLQQVSANEEFREVYRFFNDINYVNIIPQIIREPSSSNVAEKKFDAYGRNLIEKIGLTNEKTRNSYLKKLNDVLKAAVPDFESLKFSKQNGKENHLHIKFKSWRSKTELHNETTAWPRLGFAFQRMATKMAAPSQKCSAG